MFRACLHIWITVCESHRGGAGAWQCISSGGPVRKRLDPIGPDNMNLHDRWVLSCASWQCHGTWRQSKPG